MCEFKVGDVVRRVSKYAHDSVEPLGLATVRLADRPFEFKVEGGRLYHAAENYELVERKPLTDVNTLPYTFKVGDKGKTRAGTDYEVIGEFGPTAAYSTKQVVAVIGGGLARREIDGRFAFNQRREGPADLLPPPTYVWRVELTGVKNPGKSGLVEMTSTRRYATEEQALAGIKRGRDAYTSVEGPFKEEKKYV